MELIRIDSDNEKFVDSINAGDRAKPWVHVNSYWRENSERRSDVHARLAYVEGIGRGCPVDC